MDAETAETIVDEIEAALCALEGTPNVLTLDEWDCLVEMLISDPTLHCEFARWTRELTGEEKSPLLH